jgi:uncharacterized cupin superfamily protein
MTVRTTPFDQAPAYAAPRHAGVHAVRLQGLEAGPTENFWTAISFYLPGGTAEWSPTAGETVYVVLDGELTVVTDDGEHVLAPYDSIHLTEGTMRAVVNRTPRPATLLVTIATK